VLEYSELPKELIHARDPPSNSAGENTPGELQFRAAHICVNMFSTEFLARLGGADELSLPFHLAKKKIKHAVKNGAWREVDPEAPNGIKLERFIFDAFRFCPEEKVAVLEVERGEEFAPIKNASGPGVPDSPDTARDMVLAYHKRLLTSAGVGLESMDAGTDTEAEGKKEKGGKKKEKGKGKGNKEKKGKKGEGKGKKGKKGEEGQAEEPGGAEVDVIARGEIPPLLSYAGEGLRGAL
jgi:hypothetical protein